MTAPLNSMLVKIVADVISTDSAGNVVEAIPVYESAVPVENSAGQVVAPTQMVEDDRGIPVRIVAGLIDENAAGQAVGSTVGNIAP